MWEHARSHKNEGDVTRLRHRFAAGRGDRFPDLVPTEAPGVVPGRVKRALRVGGWPFYLIAALTWIGLLCGESTPGKYVGLLLVLLLPSLIVLVWFMGGLLTCCVRRRWHPVLKRFAPAAVILILAIASVWWQAGLKVRVALSAGALRHAAEESQQGSVIHNRRIGLYGVTTIKPAAGGAYLYLHGGGMVQADEWALAYFPNGKPADPNIYEHIYGPWYEWTALPDPGFDR